MRRPLLALAALVATAAPAGHAHGKVVSVPMPATPPPDDRDFWRALLEPHAAEVDAITAEVQQWVVVPLESAYGVDLADTVAHRDQVLRAALGKLVQARRLAPDNALVLTQLGIVADELGHTRQAIEALQACVALVGPDKATVEVTGRLGAIYLRLGDLDAALRYLRLAQGPATSASASAALIALATTLALRGEVSDGIDVLVAALAGTTELSADQWGVAFALAVLYDRDDQRGAAFAVLDKLQAVLADQGYAPQMQTWLASARFTPPEDEHYYQAMLYETLGHTAEARAEWALYAATGGVFRARALQHVAALDEARRHPAPEPTSGRLHGHVTRVVP